MKKKLKLPILLMAVVVMLSIFYIKEAQNNKTNTTPAGSNNLTASTLNPEFTEARIERIEEVNAQIKELEELIAGGTLNADGVLETTVKIDNLKEVKKLETDLEEVIIKQLEYDDVLVVLSNNEVVVDVYTSDEIDILTKIEILKLASVSFDNYAEEFSIKITSASE
ncbi:MAG: SpoIIIAH-like family protein [Anaeroplasma sp.]